MPKTLFSLVRYLPAALLVALCAPAWAASSLVNIQQAPVPDPNAPVTLEELIDRQIAKCWHIPALPNPDNIPTIFVVASLDKQGNIVNITLDEKSKAEFKKDPVFRKIAISATVGLKQCSPFLALPVTEYAKWRTLVLKFNVASMMDKAQ